MAGTGGRGGGDRFGRFRRPRGLPGDGDAGAEELAFVLLVLGGDALGNRLGALEGGGRIEESALFAAVEFGGALGTGLREIIGGRQGVAAVEATAGGDVLDHAGQARRGDVERVAHGAEAFVKGLLAEGGAVGTGAVLIAVLTVFTILVHVRILLVFVNRNEQSLPRLLRPRTGCKFR